MEASGAVYARVPEGGAAALEEAIRKARTIPRRGPLGVLAFVPGQHDYALVDRWGKSDDMPHWSEGPDLSKASELAGLSRAVGEVIAFYEIEEGSALGVYGVWRGGELVRSLERAEGIWSRVSGAPQAWEAALFKNAERILQVVREDGDDEPRAKAELGRGTIEQGARWPGPPLFPALRGLRLPLYGLQPWPKRKDVVAKL